MTIYGAKAQYVEKADENPPLDKAGQKYIQAVTGTLLYYARAVDPTILVALSTIAAQQAKLTQLTMEQAKQLLDYCASQEDAVLTYNASDMILAVQSNAGYLTKNQARSRAGGHFFMSIDVPYPPNNASAAEAELGALFLNAKEAVNIRNILQEMKHPQPPTPIQTNNSTVEGVLNNKVQPKRMKSMDMRIHWLLCRRAQSQFWYYWRPGKTNLADYFTKHHPPAHHRNVRAEFLTKIK